MRANKRYGHKTMGWMVTGKMSMHESKVRDEGLVHGSKLGEWIEDIQRKSKESNVS